MSSASPDRDPGRDGRERGPELVTESDTAGERVAVYAYKGQPFTALGHETRNV